MKSNGFIDFLRSIMDSPPPIGHIPPAPPQYESSIYLRDDGQPRDDYEGHAMASEHQAADDRDEDMLDREEHKAARRRKDNEENNVADDESDALDPDVADALNPNVPAHDRNNPTKEDLA